MTLTDVLDNLSGSCPLDSEEDFRSFHYYLYYFFMANENLTAAVFLT